MNGVMQVVVIGAGATAVMDIWGIARHALFGIPRPDYAHLGRWLAHMPHGRFRHVSIKDAPVMRGEVIVGWGAHYLTGITFAAVLIAWKGIEWLEHPAAGPALLVGISTVAAPFLVMQPAMGAGVAASRTPRPGVARLQSLHTHAVFGIGLYAAGWLSLIVS